LRSEADISRRVAPGVTVNGGWGDWRGPQRSEDTGRPIHDRAVGACRLTGAAGVAKGGIECGSEQWRAEKHALLAGFFAQQIPHSINKKERPHMPLPACVLAIAHGPLGP